MNASGLETLDNIWVSVETTLRVDSAYARTRLFEMAKWLEESQNCWTGSKRRRRKSRHGWNKSADHTTQEEPPPEGGSSLLRQLCPL